MEGIKVLSFSRDLAGPFCTMLLCDLGAEAVKMEEPGRWDLARFIGPHIQGNSSYFLSINRGQKSLTLDLQKPEAQNISGIEKKNDILIENIRLGVMDRLELGYAKFAKHNFRIIYASITGFGQKGP